MVRPTNTRPGANYISSVSSSPQWLLLRLRLRRPLTLYIDVGDALLTSMSTWPGRAGPGRGLTNERLGNDSTTAKTAAPPAPTSERIYYDDDDDAPRYDGHLIEITPLYTYYCPRPGRRGSDFDKSVTYYAFIRRPTGGVRRSGE